MNEVEKQIIRLSDKVTCLQQELSERDVVVQDMENCLHRTGGHLSVEATNIKYGKEEVDKIREDVKSLSATNKVAQDWMLNASAKMESLQRELLGKIWSFKKWITMYSKLTHGAPKPKIWKRKH